jgi:hypothetical protein
MPKVNTKDTYKIHTKPEWHLQAVFVEVSDVVNEFVVPDYISAAYIEDYFSKKELPRNIKTKTETTDLKEIKSPEMRAALKRHQGLMEPWHCVIIKFVASKKVATSRRVQHLHNGRA